MATHYQKKRLLFHRDYRGFQGGHLKVFDYFNHARLSDRFAPEIFVTPESDPDHLWRSEIGLIPRYDPERADCLFIAGMDWKALHSFPGIENKVPVVNLIQGMRHSNPADPLHAFLPRLAIRICVSPEIADALKLTGKCNGPIYSIPNGVDRSRLPTDRAVRKTDVFIAGLKRPDLAGDLQIRLEQLGLSVDCVVAPLERSEFLHKMGCARIVVTLPIEEEGFFLPALEAMMLGCAVICPDCIGNRSFCIDGESCLMPPSELEALAAAVIKLNSDNAFRNAMIDRATAKSAEFGIQHERRAFLEILSRV